MSSEMRTKEKRQKKEKINLKKMIKRVLVLEC